MTRRAVFTRADMEAAAAVAVERGVSVALETKDGNRITVTPQTAPKADPFDFVDMSR